MKFRALFIIALTLVSLQQMHIAAMTARQQLGNAIKDIDLKLVRSLLCEYRFDKEIYSPGHQKNTLLHEACDVMLQYSHKPDDPINIIVKELLTIGREYDVNAKNEVGDTPFHYINKGNRHPEPCMVNLFFEKEADPNIPNEKGDTPFHYLVKGKTPPDKRESEGYHSAIIRLFLENLADPNIKNDDGFTLFHLICQLDDFALIKLFLDHKAKPNIQNNEGTTPYYYITSKTYRPKLIALFLKHGAREDIPNNNGETPYSTGLEKAGEHKEEEFRELHNKDRDWHYVQGYWQEYKKDLPGFIKRRFRYYAPDVPHDDFIDKDQNIITMVTIHDDINDQKNEAYYDPGNEQFKGIMEFAKNYITTYNQKKKMLVQKKIIHLISFSWQNDMVSSAGKLAEYLDEAYSNSRLIFLTHGFGSDVANLTSHRLGYLQEVNEVIKEENKNLEEDERKTYKGRIKLLLYFAPTCRHLIPEKDRSSFIDPLGIVYDKMNNMVATKPPINYNLMLIFHSPDDKKIKPDAFDDNMKAVARGSIGMGTLMLYVAGENFKEEGTSLSTVLMGAAGGITLSYALWSSHNKMQTIASLSYRRYKKVKPKNGSSGNSFTIKGPKVHLETMVNGKYIKHSAPELLENLSIIFKILKTQYFAELARSRSFCININIDKNVQDKLLEYLDKNEDDFNDNKKKANIKNHFKFWTNRQNNCAVQCWLENEPNETDGNLYFYWARNNEKLRTNVNVQIDSDALKGQAKRTSSSHKKLFEHIKGLQ